jgi:AraC family transcriptional regulator of adaptative response/methylated-DNA-[protein]-cysteine methyltransferase
MPLLRFARVETSAGPMLVAETSLGAAAIARAGSEGAFVAALERRFPDADVVSSELDTTWLSALLEGRAVPLPGVDLGGLSVFDAAVYRAVREIPRGETATYGEVAGMVGAPMAARAVGGAMARCPLFPAVPCHRVVRAADGWSGWGGDVALKRRLLAAERRA